MASKTTIRCAYKECRKVKTAYKSQYFKKNRYCNSTCYQKSIKRWKPVQDYWGKHNVADVAEYVFGI